MRIIIIAVIIIAIMLNPNGTNYPPNRRVELTPSAVLFVLEIQAISLMRMRERSPYKHMGCHCLRFCFVGVRPRTMLKSLFPFSCSLSLTVDHLEASGS